MLLQRVLVDPVFGFRRAGTLGQQQLVFVCRGIFGRGVAAETGTGEV